VSQEVIVLRRILLIIIFGFILSACGNKTSSDLENVSSQAIDPTVVHLTDTVGDPNTLKVSSMLSQDRALASAKEYGPRTGKWFEGENGFNILTSTPSPVRQAGTDVGTGFSKVPEGRSVRFQITSRDKEGNRVELLKEYIVDNRNNDKRQLDFTYQMPEQPDTNYLLSIEILSTENVVEDTFLAPLFVPAHELNARLSVKPPAVGSDQTELTLYNTGPTNLYYGYGYEIYREEPEGWTLVPDDRSVATIAMQARPSESFVEKVVFPQKLEPGRYRLVKSFNGFMTDISVKLSADFEIQ
jgi:hypothetical protein